MELSETELRSLVREALATHARQMMSAASTPEIWHAHASHRVLPLASGGDGDGTCLIEPAVWCNHCGYCLSYGH